MGSAIRDILALISWTQPKDQELSLDLVSLMNEIQKTQSRYPRKMLIFTGFNALLIFLLQWQAFYINDKFEIDPAYMSLLAILVVFITIVAWGFWTLLWGKYRILGLLIFLIPIGFFMLYYPNVSGDMRFAGVKPRYWANAVSYVEPSKNSVGAIDVKTTTEIDFPQFLGPHRDARVNFVRLADSWSTAPEQLWRIDIGEGWSGFVVVNGYAITQEQRGAEECVTCYDVNTHEIKWINRSQRRHEDVGAMGKVGPRATPTVHEGLVYVTSATGVLDCIDGGTGELVWSADVPQLVGIEQVVSKNSMGLTYTTENSRIVWGRSMSPLIVDDVVVVPAGGPHGASGESNPTVTMIAFDKKTGLEKWRGGKRMPSYGSPTLATIGGRKQILLVAENCAVGHDAETGQELWSFERRGDSTADANCSQVTVIAKNDNRLILSKGYNLGGEIIQVTSSDGVWTAKSLDKDPRILKTKLTNPVIFDGHAYSLSDGYLECAHIDTFARVWKHRGGFGHGQILLVGDKLLVHSESGKLFLIQATPSGYTELGSFKTIDGICWNTLCLYGDLLLVRSEQEAACYRLPTEAK